MRFGQSLTTTLHIHNIYIMCTDCTHTTFYSIAQIKLKKDGTDFIIVENYQKLTDILEKKTKNNMLIYGIRSEQPAMLCRCFIMQQKKCRC